MNRTRLPVRGAVAFLAALALLAACGTRDELVEGKALTDAQLHTLVERSYPYVAMFNVNNKFAARQGWNTVVADTQLKDHTMTDIARPNNDTFYISAMLDLRGDAVIIELPAFDTDYASLMVTGYDHYVNIPMATRLGDFRSPTRILLYTERTEGYDGAPVHGVDRYFEATGDFVSAVIRLMPHRTEPERLARIREQASEVRVVTLSELEEGEKRAVSDPGAPPVGATDLDVFENDLAEVMQFVFNHTTFDPENVDDQAVLAAWAPLGVAPGKDFEDERVAHLDGARVRAVAADVQDHYLSLLGTPDNPLHVQGPVMFYPKGKTTIEAVLATSIIGPIGLPQEEAVYPPVVTADGEPMNAMHDYVIRMSADELPPARAFWSATLYDLENGFFIPNDRKKYSVGQNAGMQLDANGGIAIYVAAEQPQGVPVDNWLPIERKDENLNMILRIYVPDLEAYAHWTPPVAERVSGT